jgi:NitT/TauT family transport system substrate-binding protein
VGALVALLGAGGCGGGGQDKDAAIVGAAKQGNFNASMRLEWVPQAQFAGFLVAQEKGWYANAGVNMTIKPAGPSVFPQNQLATGADDFGVQQVPQTISANASGAREVDVMQYHQNSESAYVARRSSGIRTVADVRGKRVGLWLGGNELEFLAMLKKAGIPRDQVRIIPQGETVTPFLQGRYDVSQVTPFNELGLITQKVPMGELNVMYASDSGVALLGDGLTTTEKLIRERPEVVQAVVTESVRGWKWALEHPDEAAKIAVSVNPELDLPHQRFMMRATARLICQGPTLDRTKGLGWIRGSDFTTARDVLRGADQLKGRVDVQAAYTNRFIERVPLRLRTVDCGPYTR